MLNVNSQTEKPLMEWDADEVAAALKIMTQFDVNKNGCVGPHYT